MHLIIPERALYELATQCLANRNGASRSQEQNIQQLTGVNDLCTFAKTVVLRLTPPNSKPQITLQRNKLEPKKNQKTENKRTANMNTS